MIPIVLVFSFSNCSQKEKIKYIKSPCPILKVWDNNTSVPKLKIDYKVIPDGFALKEKEFYTWADYTKLLKKKLIISIALNTLYERQIREYNNKFNEKKKNDTN